MKTCYACEQRKPETAFTWDEYFCDECYEKCSHCGHGSFYPMYGCAPHTHGGAWQTGSFVGLTMLLPRHEWPANFEEDEEAPGCGVYTHCPVCGYPKDNDKPGEGKIEGGREPHGN